MECEFPVADMAPVLASVERVEFGGNPRLTAAAGADTLAAGAYTRSLFSLT
jgi:hypothetical protein